MRRFRAAGRLFIEICTTAQVAAVLEELRNTDGEEVVCVISCDKLKEWEISNVDPRGESVKYESDAPRWVIISAARDSVREVKSARET